MPPRITRVHPVRTVYRSGPQNSGGPPVPPFGSDHFSGAPATKSTTCFCARGSFCNTATSTRCTALPCRADTAAAFLPEDGLSVEYSATGGAVGIHNRAPKAGEPAWWFATGGLRHNFGLITVLTSDGASRKRTLLFSGINSDGAEAGARFFTAPDKLEDLNRRFQQAGYQEWPPRYQIVVRTESMDTYSLQTRFEYLRVLK